MVRVMIIKMVMNHENTAACYSCDRDHNVHDHNHDNSSVWYSACLRNTLPMPLCVQASSWRERPGCFGVVPGDRMKVPKRQWRSRRWHHLPDCKGGHLPDICLVFFTGLSSSGFSMYRGSCLEFDTSVFSQQCCWVPSFGNHLHKKQQIFVVGVISTFLHTLCACSSWQNVADLGELPQVVYRTRI